MAALNPSPLCLTHSSCPPSQLFQPLVSALWTPHCRPLPTGCWKENLLTDLLHSHKWMAHCFLTVPKTFDFLKGPVPKHSDSPIGEIQDSKYISQSQKVWDIFRKGEYVLGLLVTLILWKKCRSYMWSLLYSLYYSQLQYFLFLSMLLQGIELTRRR